MPISECRDLDPIDHGSSNYSYPAYTGTTVSFACNTGFSLEGSLTTICETDGAWSSKSPLCKELMCPGLTPPQYGHILYTESLGSLGAKNGTGAHISCDNGFEYNITDYSVSCVYGKSLPYI